jgi:hypothetical protein
LLETVTKSGGARRRRRLLAHPSNAKTVRVRDGSPAVTDEPFAKSKEVLAGYDVLDCEGIERAIEIVTSGDPAARHFAVAGGGSDVGERTRTARPVATAIGPGAARAVGRKATVRPR